MSDETATSSDFIFHLRALSRVIYVVTDEEDRFLVKLRDMLAKAKNTTSGTYYVDRCWVYTSTFGMVPIKTLIQDWSTKAHAVDNDTIGFNAAMERVYKDDPKEERNFYVITDPERWLTDAQMTRRVLNVIHQVHNDNRTLKILIFVGTRKVIPEALANYVEVVHDTMRPEDTMAVVEAACKHLPGVEPPPNALNIFKGLTGFQVDMAIAQSITATKKDPKGPKRIDPTIVADYKKRQLKKTDLVTYLDTLPTFDEVGGNDRFKEWALETRAAWSEEGQRFGLKPPKGVLLVGIWGCAKSLSSKAMAQAWGLPVVALEMGKLRSANVGQSEQNVYRAIRIIEAAAPCVVWIDEAEKTLSGGQSSAQSDAGTTSRTIGILSTWLQETSAQVCVALTANGLKTLPVEFINRMDERFFFDLPNDDERIEIIRIHLRKAGQRPENYQLAELAEKAKGMVGREIEQAIQAAMRKSFVARRPRLDEKLLSDILGSKPRILKTMVDDVRELVEWVGFDPDANDGIKARLASAPREGSSFKIVGDA